MSDLACIQDYLFMLNQRKSFCTTIHADYKRSQVLIIFCPPIMLHIARFTP